MRQKSLASGFFLDKSVPLSYNLFVALNSPSGKNKGGSHSVGFVSVPSDHKHGENGNQPERMFMVMLGKNLFNHIEYLIVKITLLLLALIGAVKLILLELKAFFF